MNIKLQMMEWTVSTTFGNNYEIIYTTPESPQTMVGDLPWWFWN